jgi:hypothetical protein
MVRRTRNRPRSVSPLLPRIPYRRGSNRAERGRSASGKCPRFRSALGSILNRDKESRPASDRKNTGKSRRRMRPIATPGTTSGPLGTDSERRRGLAWRPC